MTRFMTTSGEDEELNIDVDDVLEIDLIGGEDSVDSSLPTPRLELVGMTSEEEILFIKRLVKKESGNESLPIYIVYGLDKMIAGYLDLELSNILEIKFVGSGKYILRLISEEGEIEILSPNLDDLEINRLINFIRVRG